LSGFEFYHADRARQRGAWAESARRGETLIELPASLAAKVLLLNEMLAQKVSPAELARRLHTRSQDIQHVIDLGHATRIDTIASALAALGKRLELSIVPA